MSTLFSLSSSSREDSDDGDAAAAQQHQVPAAQESETRPVVSQPSSPLVQEEPNEPDKPTLQPATSHELFTKPAGEQTTLILEPLLPSQPERQLQLSGKPQREEADEESLPDAVDGGQESFTLSEEQVEKKLWAAVEETEAGVERGMERVESVGEEEEDGEGVTGG